MRNLFFAHTDNGKSGFVKQYFISQFKKCNQFIKQRHLTGGDSFFFLNRAWKKPAKDANKIEIPGMNNSKVFSN